MQNDMREVNDMSFTREVEWSNRTWTKIKTYVMYPDGTRECKRIDLVRTDILQ